MPATVPGKAALYGFAIVAGLILPVLPVTVYNFVQGDAVVFSGNGAIAFYDEADKQFVCPIPSCRKRFKEKRYLKQHVKIHVDMKPYRCNVCDYRSCWKVALLRHMKKAHPQTIVPEKDLQ